MKKFICKHFGHKWTYFFSSVTTARHDIRVCKRCGHTQMLHRSVPVYGTGWFGLVQFTEKGAKKYFEGSGIKI